MDRETACAIIGSPSKNKKLNKQSRSLRRNNIFSKFHANNPKLKFANSSMKVNKISTALQTITQVCDGSSTISPASAQKSLNSLKMMGLDKYILPPAPVVAAAAEINSANKIIKNSKTNTLSANSIQSATNAVKNVVNLTTPPEAPLTQINQAITKANTALNNAKERVSLKNVENKLQNAISALQKFNYQQGGKRKTRKSSK